MNHHEKFFTSLLFFNIIEVEIIKDIQEVEVKKFNLLAIFTVLRRLQILYLISDVYHLHGFVFAPRTANEAFYDTIRAFELSEKYQVPVIIFTDQFLKCNFFHGLHGRAIPVATGIKMNTNEQIVKCEIAASKTGFW